MTAPKKTRAPGAGVKADDGVATERKQVRLDAASEGVLLKVGGGNVISLMTGKPVELPAYRDCRGPMVSFQACTANGWVAVQANKTVLGLVLHRSVSLPGSPAQWMRWAISERCSGCRVVAGATRQDALDSLAMKVAYFGGELTFLQWIKSASIAAKMTGT